eukprot:37975-Prorocentrum_lima.AAC.1
MLPMKNVSCRSWSAKGKKSADFIWLNRISYRLFKTQKTELDWNPFRDFEYVANLQAKEELQQ